MPIAISSASKATTFHSGLPKRQSASSAWPPATVCRSHETDRRVNASTFTTTSKKNGEYTKDRCGNSSAMGSVKTNTANAQGVDRHSAPPRCRSVLAVNAK
ncbi:hypothetical protein G6F24_017977 [Rhizopus arrhizus]|nr:hypothetical protein G6F24_017977 [Rhizopus arrhizus]